MCAFEELTRRHAILILIGRAASAPRNSSSSLDTLQVSLMRFSSP
jgi:hypothetical protein